MSYMGLIPALVVMHVCSDSSLCVKVLAIIFALILTTRTAKVKVGRTSGGPVRTAQQPEDHCFLDTFFNCLFDSA